MKEKRRLRVYDNRFLRRIFAPKRYEVIGEWRKLHNEELNYLYCSPNIVLVIKSRRIRSAGHVARMGENRGVYGLLVGKPDGKKPLGGWSSCEFNNKIDFQEEGWGYGLDRAGSG